MQGGQHPAMYNLSRNKTLSPTAPRLSGFSEASPPFTSGSLFGGAPPTRPPAYSAAPRPARGGPTIRHRQHHSTILNNLDSR